MCPFWSCPVCVGRLKKPLASVACTVFCNCSVFCGICLHALGPKYDHLKCINKILTEQTITWLNKKCSAERCCPIFPVCPVAEPVIQVLSLCLLWSAAFTTDAVSSTTNFYLLSGSHANVLREGLGESTSHGLLGNRNPSSQQQEQPPKQRQQSYNKVPALTKLWRLLFQSFTFHASALLKIWIILYHGQQLCFLRKHFMMFASSRNSTFLQGVLHK